MKSIRRVNLFLGLAAMCFAAGSLSAQTAVVGSFTLPSETHWGTAALPAGDYTFALGYFSTSGIKVITISRGKRAVAFVLAQAYSPASSSDRSLMMIREQRVRSLHLASAGATYYFPAHKNDRELLAIRSSVRPGVAVIPVSVK